MKLRGLFYNVSMPTPILATKLYIPLPRPSIVLAAYLFSLLTTILPAVQAARIYPADALRYE